MRRQFTVGSIVLGVIVSTAALSASGIGPNADVPVQEKAQTDPTKASKNMDQVVAYPMEKVLEAARQAMLTYGCELETKKEKPNYIECQRGRHMGAFVGSGGERIAVTLTAKGTDTRVEVKTIKGFVGGAGMKNWSTPIFAEIAKILKGA